MFTVDGKEVGSLFLCFVVALVSVGKKRLSNSVLINEIFLSSFEPGAYEIKISKN